MAQAAETNEALSGAVYAITVLFDLEEGVFEDFHRLVCENAEQSVTSEPGCFRFDVLTPLGAEGDRQILLYEIYADRAAFDVHLNSAHFKSFDDQTKRMIRQKTVAVFALNEHAKRSQPA